MKNVSKFDVLVIGGGPGGIEAAIQSARRKFSVGLVTASQTGGRAVWNSLVPSKVWVHVAEKILQKNHNWEEKEHTYPTIDGLKHKINQASQRISQHYQTLLESLSVQIIMGKARYEGERKVSVETVEGNKQHIYAKYCVLATGSVPIFFEGVKPNGDRIIAPRFVNQLKEIPSSLIMIGGGVTGCEYASAFAALGTKVTIVTDIPVLLPQMDSDIQKALKKSFLDRGIFIRNSAPVHKMLQQGRQVLVTLPDQEVIKTDYAFLALGRRADFSFLPDKKINFQLSSDNGLWTDEFLQTSETNVYAVGDVTGGMMVANKALYQARIAVAHLSGEKVQAFNPNDVINAVYTYPEIAALGLTTKGVQSKGIQTKIVRKEYRNLIKCHLDSYSDGFLKLILDAKNDELLGTHLIGAHAAELLAPILVGKRCGLKYSNLGILPFAYPTFSELLLIGSHQME